MQNKANYQSSGSAVIIMTIIGMVACTALCPGDGTELVWPCNADNKNNLASTKQCCRTNNQTRFILDLEEEIDP
jgi:hypothetical protein